jgi:hypothetical protein
MKLSFASHSQICSILLCMLATLLLTGCGSDEESHNSATAIDPTSSLLIPHTGLIDRSATNNPASSASTAQPTPMTDTTTAPGAAEGGVSAGPTTGSASSAAPPVKTISGAVTVGWQPPTENNDGSSLSNLAGYRVYYGTAVDNLSQSVKLANPGLTTYTITNLTSGTWYIAISAYASDGAESARSGTVTTSI